MSAIKTWAPRTYVSMWCSIHQEPKKEFLHACSAMETSYSADIPIHLLYITRKRRTVEDSHKIVYVLRTGISHEILHFCLVQPCNEKNDHQQREMLRISECDEINSSHSTGITLLHTPHPPWNNYGVSETGGNWENTKLQIFTPSPLERAIGSCSNGVVNQRVMNWTKRIH